MNHRKLHYSITVDLLRPIDDEAFQEVDDEYEIENWHDKMDKEIIMEYLDAIVRYDMKHCNYFNATLEFKIDEWEEDRPYYTLILDLKEPLADENIQNLIDEYGDRMVMEEDMSNEEIIGEYIRAIIHNSVNFERAISANIYVDSL